MELIIPIKINLKSTALMSEIFYLNNLDSRIRSAYICATALRPSLINLKTFLSIELLKKITLTDSFFISHLCVPKSRSRGQLYLPDLYYFWLPQFQPKGHVNYFFSRLESMTSKLFPTFLRTCYISL